MKWLNLNKQAPKDGEKVLVYARAGYVDIARWYDEWKQFTDVENSTVCGVKYWMPLPEPPTTKETNG